MRVTDVRVGVDDGVLRDRCCCPEKLPANLAFCEERLLRFFRVADARLAGREWLADELSIADFALYPICAVRKPAASTRPATCRT